MVKFVFCLGKIGVIFGKTPLLDFQKLGGCGFWRVDVLFKEEQGIVHCTIYGNEGLLKGFRVSDELFGDGNIEL